MKKFLLTIGFFVWAAFVMAQNIQITGKVTDNNSGATLPGVAVMEKGTANGTVTNRDGIYQIEAGLNSTLSFSFVGYSTKEVAVEGRNQLNVVLEESVQAIDEVVVTALGISQEKKSLGYATQEVGAEVITSVNAPYNEVNLKAADGKVSKVNLRYTTDPTTEPHMYIGYSELELILAEASVRGWINSSAQEHYENGVKASFGFYNMYAAGYAAYVNETAAEEYLQQPLVDFSNAATNDEKLELIMMQKYIPSFLQGGWRMYFDHLRTGYPEFRINEGVTPPTRWIYPTSEYQENSDNVTEAITRQFGAGNDKTRVTPWWLE